MTLLLLQQQAVLLSARGSHARPVGYHKETMAASQWVSHSSGSHASPDVSLPAQHQHVEHPELEQLLHCRRRRVL
jgi:hypothetical protein